MKKINITTGVLVIYLIVMSVWGWPGKQPDPDWVQYFSVMGVSLFVILLLRYLQVKRMKMRDKWKEENRHSTEKKDIFRLKRAKSCLKRV